MGVESRLVVVICNASAFIGARSLNSSFGCPPCDLVDSVWESVVECRVMNAIEERDEDVKDEEGDEEFEHVGGCYVGFFCVKLCGGIGMELSMPLDCCIPRVDGVEMRRRECIIRFVFSKALMIVLGSCGPRVYLGSRVEGTTWYPCPVIDASFLICCLGYSILSNGLIPLPTAISASVGFFRPSIGHASHISSADQPARRNLCITSSRR